MAESNEHMETIGKIWDSLSTARRILFLVFVVGLLFAATSVGYWFGIRQADDRVAALEAKHQRELTNQDEGRLLQIRDLRDQLGNHLWSKEANCPDLENAEPLQTSQESFLAEYLKQRSGNKTTLQMGSFFGKYAGRAVHWDGFVWDVVDEGHLVRVTMAFPQYKSPETLLANFYFPKEVAYTKEHLYRGDWLLVRGVLNRSGEVVKCSVSGEGGGVEPSKLRLTAPFAVPTIPSVSP